MANTPQKGKTRHITWLSFLFKVQCFYRDENDLVPDDKHCIWGKRNALWFWQHFGRIFLFSYLLLIALYTNSTYIIWLKKYSVVFYFLIFLTRDYFLFFVSSSSIADFGKVWLDTYIKIIVICRDIHQTLRKIIAVDLKKILSNFLFCSFIY